MDSNGWVQIDNDRAILFLYEKTGWCDVEIGRGSSQNLPRFCTRTMAVFCQDRLWTHLREDNI